MEKFEQHIKRMKGLREVYEVGTGQHNILSILINECEEALCQPHVIGSLPLPDFLYNNGYGCILSGVQGDSDVSDEWEKWKNDVFGNYR